MLGMSRREFLLGTAATAAATSATYSFGKSAFAADMELPLNYTSHEILPGKLTENMMGFGTGGPAPTIRLKQHEKMTIDVVNNLHEASVVHWHGLRHENAQDGVPYLTQTQSSRANNIDITSGHLMQGPSGTILTATH